MSQNDNSVQNESNAINAYQDPYERFLLQEKYQKNLIPFDHSSKFARKFNKLKVKLFDAKNNMIQGATMGFMVGGLFGTAIGCYQAFYSRRFSHIIITALVSGCSFGFILGCGSMIRTAEIKVNERQLMENEWMNVHYFNHILKTKLH